MVRAGEAPSCLPPHSPYPADGPEDGVIPHLHPFQVPRRAASFSAWPTRPSSLTDDPISPLPNDGCLLSTNHGPGLMANKYGKQKMEPELWEQKRIPHLPQPHNHLAKVKALPWPRNHVLPGLPGTLPPTF